MNKHIVTVAVAATMTAVSLVSFKWGHETGKKASVNQLREEQLAQLDDEYNDKLNGFKGSLEELKDHKQVLSNWYIEETRVINEMYDEVINNL